MVKRTFMVLGVTIVLVIVAVIAYYLWTIMQTPSVSTIPHYDTLTTPPTTTSPTTTTQTPTIPIVQGLENCSSPSIIYVYVSQEQKENAEKFLETFIHEATRQGINVQNIGRCMVNATAQGWRLRLYPSLLIKGNISSLERYVEDYVDGLGIIDYSISEAVARYLQINVTYTYHVKVYVVNGLSKWTKRNITLTPEFIKTLQSIALAHVDSVERIDDNPPIKVDYRPTFLFYSKDDLTKGIIYMEKIGENYYTIKKQYMLLLATEFFMTRFVEIYFDPKVPEEDIPVVGNREAPIILYIFEDYWCPYCAKFYKVNHELITKLINNNTLQLHPLDFIVHRNVAELHALTRCLYEYTGNSSIYFNITLDLYYGFIDKGERPTIDTVLGIINKSMSNEMVNKIISCANDKVNEILDETNSFHDKYGVRATPTLLFWNRETGKGMLIEGYIDEEEFKNIIGWLRK